MKVHLLLEKPTRFDVVRDTPEEFIKGIFSTDKLAMRHLNSLNVEITEDVHQGYARKEGLYIEEVEVQEDLDRIELHWREVEDGPRPCGNCIHFDGGVTCRQYDLPCKECRYAYCVGQLWLKAPPLESVDEPKAEVQI